MTPAQAHKLKPAMTVLSPDFNSVVSADSTNLAVYLATTKSSELTPEQKLLWEILKDCIEVVCGAAAGKLVVSQRERDLHWIKSDAGDIFSFCYVCDLLNIDSGQLRRALLENKIKIGHPLICLHCAHRWSTKMKPRRKMQCPQCGRAFGTAMQEKEMEEQKFCRAPNVT